MHSKKKKNGVGGKRGGKPLGHLKICVVWSLTLPLPEQLVLTSFGIPWAENTFYHVDNEDSDITLMIAEPNSSW